MTSARPTLFIDRWSFGFVAALPATHRWLAPFLALAWLFPRAPAAGVPNPAEWCPSPAPGSRVEAPPEILAVNGILKTDLALYSDRAAPDAAVRYCYRTPDGRVAPTLRVHPGDQVVLRLTNRLAGTPAGAMAGMHHPHGGRPSGAPGEGPCSSGAMTPVATNLHFHGMTLPPVCHQDEVLQTSIQPEDPPFEYRFTVPRDEPPGLYWYHPHIHGFSSKQVTAGASGAIIVEGLEKMIPEVAGLPERVFVIRDPNLFNPDAPPSPTEPVVPKILLDPEGDVANNNTGYGKPARDLSINFVPVPYPNYPPARIRARAGQRELWRVLNASAITYLNIELKLSGAPQSLGIVAIDGSPVNQADAQGTHVKMVDHLAVPPGSRAEFIVQMPAAGARAMLFTRMVDTGPDGENDPNRNIAVVEALADAPEPPPLPVAGPAPRPTLPWVGSVQPSRTRLLYFSEQHSDPADPRSPMKFYITEAGKEPKVFDPASGPDIVVKQGEVEDWVVENRSRELHAFHIHQLHFQLRQWMKVEVDEPFLRDTVSIPYFDPESNDYPQVVLRMDFRGPDTVGVFPYHCHLLEHEDGGMMGTIRVEPTGGPAASPQQQR